MPSGEPSLTLRYLPPVRARKDFGDAIANDFRRVDADGDAGGHAFSAEPKHAVERHAGLFRLQVPEGDIQPGEGGGIVRSARARSYTWWIDHPAMLWQNASSCGIAEFTRVSSKPVPGALARADNAVLLGEHEQVAGAGADATADLQG